MALILSKTLFFLIFIVIFAFALSFIDPDNNDYF